jgi:Pyruvate/2-oxoacid:ferredoxin oxidoreductase delta subunit
VELVACRVQLGEPDSSGRRSPELIADSEFSIAVDSLITAVSQSPLLEGFEALQHDGNWLVTDQQGKLDEGILAGGDTLRLGIAGNAIVQGRNAAEALHARLSGQQDEHPKVTDRDSIGPHEINFDHKPESPAASPLTLPGDERVARGKAEVSDTISEQQFLQEVERCFSCGACMGCEHCSMFCTSACYTKLEEAGPGLYFALTLDACKKCGKCIEVCPSGFLDAI